MKKVRKVTFQISGVHGQLYTGIVEKLNPDGALQVKVTEPKEMICAVYEHRIVKDWDEKL